MFVIFKQQQSFLTVPLVIILGTEMKIMYLTDIVVFRIQTGTKMREYFWPIV